MCAVFVCHRCYCSLICYRGCCLWCCTAAWLCVAFFFVLVSAAWVVVGAAVCDVATAFYLIATAARVRCCLPVWCLCCRCHCFSCMSCRRGCMRGCYCILCHCYCCMSSAKIYDIEGIKNNLSVSSYQNIYFTTLQREKNLLLLHVVSLLLLLPMSAIIKSRTKYVRGEKWKKQRRKEKFATADKNSPSITTIHFTAFQSEKLTGPSCVVSAEATHVYTTMKSNSKEVREKSSIAEAKIATGDKNSPLFPFNNYHIYSAAATVKNHSCCCVEYKTKKGHVC